MLRPENQATLPDTLASARISADAILATKLHIPRLSPQHIPRPRLVGLLEQGLQTALTLVVAPAGSGKTSLLAEWAKQVAAPAAWFSLDSTDNDPVRFLTYFITALKRLDGRIGREALALLRDSPMLDLDRILTGLINDLAGQLSTDTVLILDDYHLITTEAIQTALLFLLDHMPPWLHLVIGTRSDPPLPLARLRVRGDLYELRAADLRFSGVEIETFLRQVMAGPVSAEIVRRLEARTEGWVAGLRLVALALQGRPAPADAEHFLTTFTGSHRHILDYLATEVLDAQPEPIQAFLLQTSFLERLTGALCDAVTGRNDGAFMLEALEQANLFLTPLDGDWYRYHTLFAEAMQHEARRRFDEAALNALFGKASRWYEQQGLLVEAVETALPAEDFSRAAALIERLVEPRGFTNELQTLRRWLERLPEDILQTHPALSFAYAVVLVFTSNFGSRPPINRLHALLQRAENHWRAEDNRPKLGQVLAFRAMMAARGQGDMALGGRLAGEALELLPEEDVQWRGVSLLLIGAGRMRAGELKAARQLLTEARALFELAGNGYGGRAATSILAGIYFRQGELRQSDQLYRQVLATAGNDLSDRIRALLNLAALAYEWNELDRAEQEVTQALDLGRQLEGEDMVTPASLLLARIQQARSQPAQAQALLYRLVAQTHQPHLLAEVSAWQARLALAAGDRVTAQRWANSYTPPTEARAFIRQEREALIFARVLIAQGRAEAALRLLEGWQSGANAQGLAGSELEILMLKALAHLSQSNLTQAGQMLLQALTLAQPEGYCRLFLDEGEPLAALLQAVIPQLKEEPLLTYAQTLLSAFPQEPVTLPTPPDTINPSPVQIQNPKSPVRVVTGKIQNPIESLSQQEERVLRLLVAGLSNSEIAQELVVSINTVKTQVKSIYRKLDVHNRREARAAAQRLNLL
jgi:LuxR family maltose regulon positive regulatory protein